MGARVLVVDDSPTIRKLVGAILERHNFEPVLAGDGFAGLDRLRFGDIDLVLLDFVMPKMNGYQFCREMRADGKVGHLPVVLMSAKSDKIRGQFVQQTGAVDAITKPFDARGLVAVVENAIDEINQQPRGGGQRRHLALQKSRQPAARREPKAPIIVLVYRVHPVRRQAVRRQGPLRQVDHPGRHHDAGRAGGDVSCQLIADS